jgi:hypothetical protein
LTSRTGNYPLIAASATYLVQGASVEQGRSVSDPVAAFIPRQPASSIAAASRVRDELIDVEVMRFLTATALQQAMDCSDRHDFKNARELLDACIAKVQASVSFVSGNALTVAMAGQLREAKTHMQDQTAFAQGGRAYTSESCQVFSAQRQVYSKHSSPMGGCYQTPTSGSRQMAFGMAKSSGMLGKGP